MAGEGNGLSTLTDQMKALRSAADPDLQISEATKKDYVRIIGDLRKVIETERNKLDNLVDLPAVGNFKTAEFVKTQFALDVNRPDTGIRDVLNKYITYLNEFEKTVNEIAGRLIANG